MLQFSALLAMIRATSRNYQADRCPFTCGYLLLIKEHIHLSKKMSFHKLKRESLSDKSTAAAEYVFIY